LAVMLSTANLPAQLIYTTELTAASRELHYFLK
jgi:hypothetical protein